MRSLLAMERTALNFLQRLSGIATLTARYVAAVRRHARGDLRHAQDDSRLAFSREVRSSLRRRPQSPIRPLRRGSDQGQSPRLDQGSRRSLRPGSIRDRDRRRATLHSARARHRDRGRFPRAVRSARSSALPTSSWSTTSGPRQSPRPSAGVMRPRRGFSSRPPAASISSPCEPWPRPASIGSASER